MVSATYGARRITIRARHRRRHQPPPRCQRSNHVDKPGVLTLVDMDDVAMYKTDADPRSCRRSRGVWHAGTGPVSPTVLTHARRRRVRHAEWRPRTSCLGRGPRLERAARIHHRRPARRGRPGGARPCTRRRPLERSGLARPSGHRQPGPLRRAQGRRGSRPSHCRRTPRRNRRDQPGRDRGAGVLRRAWPQRVAAPRPGHDRPGRRHGAVRPRRAPLRRARGRRSCAANGPRRGDAGRAGPGPPGSIRIGRPRHRHRPRTIRSRYPTWPTCAARPSAGAPSRWRPQAHTIS